MICPICLETTHTLRTRFMDAGARVEGCPRCVGRSASRITAFVPAVGYGHGLTAAHLADIQCRRVVDPKSPHPEIYRDRGRVFSVPR